MFDFFDLEEEEDNEDESDSDSELEEELVEVIVLELEGVTFMPFPPELDLLNVLNNLNIIINDCSNDTKSWQRKLFKKTGIEYCC